MKHALSLLIIIFMVACQPKNNSGFDIQEVRAFIDRTNKNYGERYHVNEPKYTQQRYTKDACILPNHASHVCGIPGIAYHFYNDGNNRELIIERSSKVVSGDSKLIIEEGIYLLRDKDNKPLDEGKYIALWKQENNVWKIYRDIWNSDILMNTKADSVYVK